MAQTEIGRGQVVIALHLSILGIQIAAVLYGTVRCIVEGRRNRNWTAGIPWLIASMFLGPINLVVMAIWR